MPLVVANVGEEIAESEYLGQHGVRLWVRGHAPIAAAIQATYEAMKRLRDGASPEELAQLVPPKLLRELTQHEQYQHMIAAFLTSG
jgi:2-methylisocitrate lyase-like PEP mutase family enzyme